MKRIIPFFFLVLFFSVIMNAQNHYSVIKKEMLHEQKFGSDMLSQTPKTTLNFTDTLIYPYYKTSTTNNFGLFNNPGYCTAVGQYYDCPQSVTVKGVVFYGLAVVATSVTVTVDLYLAGPDSLPTGSSLATGTVLVDNSTTNVHNMLMFTTPQTLNQPYVVTITYASMAPAFVIATNDSLTHNGRGEWLGCLKETTGSWKKSKFFSGGAKDFDFLIFPVVSYDIADVSFSMDSTCITNDGETIDFAINNPDIYLERMYNYYAAADSAKYQFAWNFGDTVDTIFVMDTSHQYAVAAPYIITLAYGYRGWYNYTAPQIIQKNLVMCLTPDVSDTLLYAAFKASGYEYFEMQNAPTKCISAGQYFDCPQTLSVMGVVFYGGSFPDSTINVTVELYLAGADSLPSGPALISQTKAVDSVLAHSHRVLMFNTPQIVSQPYIITITDSSAASSFFITANKSIANDGQGEWLGLIKETSDLAFKKSKYYSGGSKNFDFLIMPVVKYDLTNVTFEFNPACLVNNGDIVNFTLNCPDIYKNRMYDYFAATDSAKYQFAWNFGDTTDTIFAMDTTHQYVTIAPYVVSMGYGFKGWYNYIAPQVITQNIDVCTSIKPNDQDAIAIYPNPVTNILFIEHVNNSGIEIYNSNGSMVISRHNNDNNAKIDVSSLPGGIYLVKINSEAGVFTQKILIAH